MENRTTLVVAYYCKDVTSVMLLWIGPPYSIEGSGGRVCLLRELIPDLSKVVMDLATDRLHKFDEVSKISNERMK